ELEHKVRDTKILAHLYDSRKDFEGGTGHGLKPLSAWYIDPDSPDAQSILTAEFKALKVGHTKSNPVGWRLIPYDNDVYQEYGLLDSILLARLRPILERQVEEAGI